MNNSTPRVSRAMLYKKLYSAATANLLEEHKHALDQMTDVEREQIMNWMVAGSAMEGLDDNLFSRILWDTDYSTKPVDIAQFIDDPQYLGALCADLRPVWREDLLKVFAPESACSEWIMTGSTGTGKTFVAGIALTYIIYKLSCLRSPVEYYNLAIHSMMVFGIYSITKKQVSDTCYYNILNHVDNSPYFRERFPRDPKIESQIEFLKQPFRVLPGSRSLHAIGLNLFALCLDEANFFNAKEDKSTGRMKGQAYELYNSATTRMMTRFMRKGGVIPGMGIIISSRNQESSFTEERLRKANPDYKEGQRGFISERCFVSDYALWEALPKARFSTKTFTVEVGDRVHPSRVLRKSDIRRRGARTVDVPIDFLARFREDTDQSLRDLAGVATAGLGRFISDSSSVYECCRGALVHPFSKSELTISTEDNIKIESYFRPRDAMNMVGSRLVPKINPTAKRFIHIDLAVSGDSLGFAMGHYAGKVVVRGTTLDGLQSTSDKHIVVYDMLLRIRPPQVGQIEFSKVRAFVEFLRTLYPVYSCTFDGFQSVDFQQLLRRSGIETGVVSLDRTSEPYTVFRSALFERRVVYYKYDPLVDELLDLEYDPGRDKVDHPLKASNGKGPGKKDVADAAAAVYYTIIKCDKLADEVVTNAVLVPDDTEPDDDGVPKQGRPDIRNPVNMVSKIKPVVGSMDINKLRQLANNK